jgi:carboxyl-terminal processing protease
MARNKRFYLPLIYSILITSGIIIGYIINPGQEIKQGFGGEYSASDKINDVLQLIERDYVDTVNQKELVEQTLTDMLHNLDPHSSYIPAKQLKGIAEEMSGNFEGIGIQFRLNNDTIYVVMPINGGPSAKKGIRAGDRIVGVNGRDITGHKITNDTVTKLLKGPKGSKVQLRIYRPSIKDYLDFEIVRDKIPMYSIDIAYMVNDTTAYVKINRFAATTYDEFVEKTDRLLQKGMRNLIIDLRDNGGGYLSEATALCNDFLNEGEIIVYTEGRSRAKDFTYANARTRLENIKLIILINELSASASEIVSGAIQDNDRGTIVGRRSFGKGLVQEQLEFADKSAIRLTVARYYTPTGRCIQKSYKKGYREYEADLLHRYSNDELINPDSIHFIDSLKYVTKGGKVVYGGGGIMPDVFVPIDTSSLYSYFNALSDRGIIYQFAFRYLDQNREQLKNDYPSAESFVKNFRISETTMKELIKSAENQGVPFNKKSYRFCKADIANRLKAYIGRGIYNDDAFYPVLLQKDKTFLKAMEVFQNQASSTMMQ